MKTLSDLIFEEKFSNFNELELKAFADQLDELKTHNDFLKKIENHRRGIRINMGERWAKAKTVPTSDKIEYGKRYLIIFDNPFTNGEQLTLNPSEDYEKHAYDPCTKDEPYRILCLGIADKFAKLHLVNQWGQNCTIQWRDKGLYIKCKSDSFYSEKGWYLYRKGFASYYVHQDLHRSEVNDFWYAYPEKQKDTFVRLQDCIILDISKLPAAFEKIQKEIEAKAKKDEELKKVEEERLRKQEEAKKWWKEREDYKHLGCANGWKDIPVEIDKANKDPEAKWYSINIERCYYQYFCDKYKITYTVDSSD